MSELAPAPDIPPHAAEPRTAHHLRRVAVQCVLLSGALVALILAFTSALSPAPDEWVLMRWLRVAADHPIRSATAFFALSASLIRTVESGSIEDDRWRGL